MNKVLLMGRLGNDPELKYTANQTAVCNLSVATTKRWMKDGEKKELAVWHRVTVYGKQAENCNMYLSKGREVLVEGELSYTSYENKQGNKVYVTDIIAVTIQFIGSNVEKNSALKQIHQKSETENYHVETNAAFTSDEIPF